MRPSFYFRISSNFVTSSKDEVEISFSLENARILENSSIQSAIDLKIEALAL